MALPEERTEELTEQAEPAQIAQDTEQLFTAGDVVLGGIMFLSGVIFTVHEAAPKVLEASAHLATDPNALLVAATAIVGAGVLWQELNKPETETDDNSEPLSMSRPRI